MSNPVVECKNGKVKGFVSRGNHKDAKDVATFRGIPFAEPPLGKLRFMPPKPYEKKWDDVLDGTKFSKVPRYPVKAMESMDAYFPIRKDVETVISEDCLYLDVYTPNPKPTANLPVMVFFYGGAFSMGSNLEYDGTVFSGMNDVILVIPNYRVNVFGFLALGRESCCPGNAGLFDQHLALEWVRDNIKQFGGDQQNVTIFGESAGSMSVGYHLYSPMSKGLFHKAIFQSGTPTSMLMGGDEKCKVLKRLLDELKIKDSGNEAILNKLQAVKGEQLQQIIENFLMENQMFVPVVDGKFITENPNDSLKNRNINCKVPVIVGYNDSEGMGIMEAYVLPKYTEGFREKDFDEYTKLQVQTSMEPDDPKSFVQRVKEFYMKFEDPTDKFRYSKAFGRIVGDSIFEASSLKHAKTFSEIMPTYVYLSAFQLKLFHDKKFSGKLELKPDWCICDHGDDLLLSFGCPFAPFKLTHNPKFDKNEERISIEFMKYLTNFAKTGDPNKGVNMKIVWPRYDCTNYSTLKFGTENTEVFENNNKKEMIEFWDSV